MVSLFLVDQRDINEAREEKQDKRVAELTAEWEIKHAKTMEKAAHNEVADNSIAKVLKGVAELVRWVWITLTGKGGQFQSNEQVVSLALARIET